MKKNLTYTVDTLFPGIQGWPDKHVTVELIKLLNRE